MHAPRTLRSRLVIGIGLLAGIAVIAASVAAFAIVNTQLRHQIDESLRAQPVAFATRADFCDPRLGLGRTSRLQIQVQRVAADGTACSPDDAVLPVTEQDRAVAATGTGGGLRDVTDDGVHLRMRVAPAGGGYALQLARPLTEVDTSLRELGFFLALTATLTLGAVITLGVLFARRLTRPVLALTAAAEHIAQTDDLAVPIAVDGHDEVARLAVAFNRMTAQLARSRDRQQQLVADASHELRTPLTSLRTNVELLARSHDTGRPLTDDVTRRLYANITAQTAELTELIKELVDLARDQPPDLGTEPLQFDDVVSRAVERARPRAGDRPVEIAALALCEVRGDGQALERAVINLLDNAVKFSPPDTPVVVALREDGSYAIVEVTDAGRGIAADELPRVFDRFWRSDTSRDLPGSGLGLAIVQQTAHAHGGTIELRRAGEHGTVARLSVPLARSSPSSSRIARTPPVALHQGRAASQ
ncbi:MAG: ATP-binding protein [Cellulomonas sp.]